jgi:hypothetical protein
MNDVIAALIDTNVMAEMKAVPHKHPSVFTEEEMELTRAIVLRAGPLVGIDDKAVFAILDSTHRELMHRGIVSPLVPGEKVPESELPSIAKYVAFASALLGDDHRSIGASTGFVK